MMQVGVIGFKSQLPINYIHIFGYGTEMGDTTISCCIMGNLPSTNSTIVDADSVPYLPNHYEGH